MENINENFTNLTIEEFNNIYGVDAAQEMSKEDFLNYIENTGADYMYCSNSEEETIEEYREWFEDTELECDLICVNGLFLAMYC